MHFGTISGFCFIISFLKQYKLQKSIQQSLDSSSPGNSRFRVIRGALEKKTKCVTQNYCITFELIIYVPLRGRQCRNECEWHRCKSYKIIMRWERLAALEVAPRYMEQQPEATPSDNRLLRRWRDITAKKRGSVLKQQTLEGFVKLRSYFYLFR